MDRPSTSHQSVDKVEVFEVREHVPYQAEVTRAPTYDEESGQLYQSNWDNAWASICQLFNLLYHMQIAMVVFCLWRFALISSEGNITNIQLHIIFAGTGYQFFLVEAVLTLHKHNSWSAQLSSDGKRVIHGCLQLIGSLFVLSGTFLALAEFDMQVNTAHGICGVIALAFTLLSFVSGIITLFSSKVRLMIKNGPVKIIHVAVGIFAISMGLVTMTLGFNKEFFRETQGSLSTALMVFVVNILIYIIVQPIFNVISTTKRQL